MSEYISRQAAIDAIRRYIKNNTHEDFILNMVWVEGAQNAMQIVNDLPPVDVEPIVHCKDCRWWTKQEASLQGRCDAYGIYPTGEWYCARGERQ